MGMKLFVKDGVFYPSQYGLYQGDVINLILVGGGCGGGYSTGNTKLGGDTSFGSYAVAYSGKGAKGGKGNSTTTSYGGGGAGGFIPGASVQGGNGFGANFSAAAPYPVIIQFGNGGGSRGQYGNIYGANSACFGGGGYGTATNGEGGGGYGAGGGCGPFDNTYGGDGGQILYSSYILTAADVTNGIPVTIGFGGSDYGYRYYAAFAGSIVNNQKATDYAILNSSIMGSYGMQKTFELADGTYGITAQTSQGQSITSTTYVKFMGQDSLLSFATAFPSPFLNSSAPMYYINGYYIQLTSISSTGTVIKYILASKAKSGAAVAGDVGTLTFGATWTCVGCNERDLIVATSTTSIQVYSNWTPGSGYTTKTFSGTLPYAPSNGCCFIPYGTTGFLQFVAFNSSNGTSALNYISDYTLSTPSTSSTTYAPYIHYVCQTKCSTPYWTSNYQLSGIYYHQQVLLGGNPNQNPTDAIYYCFGTSTMRTLYCKQSNYTFGYNFLPLVGDGIGSLYYSPYNLSMTAAWGCVFGYNNNPGESYADVFGAQGSGGAGGCCMVTW